MKKIMTATLAVLFVFLMSACSSSDSSDSGSTGSSVATTTETSTGGVVSDNTSAGGATIEGESTAGDTTNSGEIDQGSAAPVSGDGSVAAFGTLTASYTPLDDETEWSALFFVSPVAFPVAALEQEYVNAITDSCARLDTTSPIIDPGNTTGGDPDNLPFVPTSISAGDVITITSSAGTYASLTAESVFGFLIYQTDGGTPIAGPMPAGLVADIPGAAGGFPAVSNVALPTAAPIEFSLSGTTISWTNSGEAGGAISITMSVIKDSDVLEQVFIECNLVDDGSHQIAAGVLPTGNIEFPLFLGARSVTRLVQSGNSALILQADSEGYLSR